jgi:hypothetical protein
MPVLIRTIRRQEGAFAQSWRTMDSGAAASGGATSPQRRLQGFGAPQPAARLCRSSATGLPRRACSRLGSRFPRRALASGLRALAACSPALGALPQRHRLAMMASASAISICDSTITLCVPALASSFSPVPEREPRLGWQRTRSISRRSAAAVIICVVAPSLSLVALT